MGRYYRRVLDSRISFPAGICEHVVFVESDHEHRWSAVSARGDGVYLRQSLRITDDVYPLLLQVLSRRSQSPRLQYGVEFFLFDLALRILLA